MRTHTAIVAMSPRMIIGVNGKMPWHISEDLQFFKKQTMGRQCVIGRRTWHEMDNLPGREVFPMSRRWNCHAGQIHPDAIICGGAEIYKLFMPVTKTLIMTQVYIDMQIVGRLEITRFPEFHYASSEVIKPKEATPSGIDIMVVRYDLCNADEEGAIAFTGFDL